MTYQDPNDPLRNTDPNRMPPRVIDDESSSMWGWIAGAVVVVLLAFALIGFLGRSDNVASNNPATPSSTVGSAPSPRPSSPLTTPSSPAPTAPAPSATPSSPPSDSTPSK